MNLTYPLVLLALAASLTLACSDSPLQRRLQAVKKVGGYTKGGNVFAEDGSICFLGGITWMEQAARRRDIRPGDSLLCDWDAP